MKSYSKTSIKTSMSNKAAPKVSLGSSSNTPKPSALMPKKSYSKKKAPGAEAFGEISFGQTGLTGES